MEKKIPIPLNQLIDSSEYENINEEEKVDRTEEINFNIEELDPFDEFYSNPDNKEKAKNNVVKLNNTKFKKDLNQNNIRNLFYNDNIYNNRFDVYLDENKPRETKIRTKQIFNNQNENKIKKQISIKKEIMTQQYLNKIGLENSQCPICLCSIGLKEEISKLKCGHVFHYICLDQWVDKKKECPFCRSKIEIKHSKTFQPIYANPEIIKNKVQTNKK